MVKRIFCMVALVAGMLPATSGAQGLEAGKVPWTVRTTGMDVATAKGMAYSQSDTGHNWARFTANTVASVVGAYVGKTALKKMIREERPDHSDNESFPSGHAAMAFAAARSIDKEFRKESIWIPIAGYAAATAIGVQRVASNRHHWYDVAAGAVVGFASAELTWWLSNMLFPQRKYNVAIGTSGNTIDVLVAL